MRHFTGLFVAMLLGASAHSQSFQTGVLPGTFNSGNCTGVTDMNNDGLDDIVILDQSRHLKIAYQQPNGDFVLHSFGTVGDDHQWGMAVGDIDNDGHKDVICGGHYDLVHVINIDGPGVFNQVNLPWADIYTQGTALGDIDNDGWLDGFVCHDDGHSAILHNQGNGTMSDGSALIDLVFAPEINGNDNAGNYGAVFCDFDRDGDIDIMIAKCRQFINDPYDPRRTNVLLVNDGNGNYTNQAQARGLVNLQQSWTAEFADYDNDGDFDCFLTTHSGTLELYNNDGNGYFTEVTEEAGLDYAGFFLQAKFADFDNDGFLDVIHAGGSHRYFKNNGNGSFSIINNVFPNNDVLHSFGIGDLNHDGWLDLYASYGNGYVTPDSQHPDKLFINNGGTNNYIVFDLEGTLSNRGAVGAVVEITGPFGVQIRDVRAGESYGITNTSLCHFGLGTATAVTEVKIYWPSGIVNVIENPAINQYHTVVEATCLLPVSTIEALGNPQLCSEGSVTLSVVQASGDYVWSNGDTGSSITADTPGIYSLIVSDGNGCAGTSNSIVVAVAKPLAATISASGEDEFCEGGSVTLTANNGTSYLWSSGETSSSIEVTTSGTYHVSISNDCETVTSSDFAVTVFDAPATPLASNVEFIAPASVTLQASGTNVRWYNSAFSSTPIYEGNSFTTPVLNQTTTYWAESMQQYGGVESNGGKINNTQVEGVYHTNSTFFLRFDAHEDVYITSVKVYSNQAGNRDIAVVTSEGATVVSGTFFIGTGEQVVPLNFFVPEGINYGLRCTNSNPRLWRDKDLTSANPFGYPFEVGDLVTITGSTATGEDFDNYYYFFYDWHVKTPSWDCTSDRIEVTAISSEDISVNELEFAQQLSLYPNPANEQIQVRMNTLGAGKAQVRVLDVAGKIITQHVWTYAAGTNNYTLNVQDLASGIYSIELSNGERRTVQQFIKN
jgi:hypothetical protein